MPPERCPRAAALGYSGRRCLQAAHGGQLAAGHQQTGRERDLGERENGSRAAWRCRLTAYLAARVFARAGAGAGREREPGASGTIDWVMGRGIGSEAFTVQMLVGYWAEWVRRR